MFHPEGPSFFELAQQALSSTERGYDLLAPKFEHTPFRTPQALLDAWGEIIAAEEGEIQAALDMGCGTGAVMRVLRPLVTDHVTGIDTSRGMLAQAKRNLADAPGDAEVRLVRCDFAEMPFEAEFDLATSFGAFGHLLESDQDAWLDALHRALKPGGRFVFVTAELPTAASPVWWAARGFNFAMHVRNAIIDPPFVMFYLTFTLPHAQRILERHGFDVEVRTDAFPRYRGARYVRATKR